MDDRRQRQKTWKQRQKITKKKIQRQNIQR